MDAHPFEQTIQDNPFETRKRQNRLRYIVFALVALALFVLFAAIYSRLQKTGILLLDAPSGIQVSLNGKAVSPERTSDGLFIPVYAGTYRLRLEKSEYQSFEQDITALPGQVVRLHPVFALLPAVNGVSGGNIRFVQASTDQKLLYYLGGNDPYLFRLEVVSQEQIRLTDKPLQNVLSVEWSDDPSVALIVEKDGVYLHEIPRFDYQNQIFLKVAGTEIVSPTWDPNDSSRIAAAYEPASGEHSLVLADKQFSHLDRLADISALTRPKVIWSPDSNHIALISQSGDASQNNLWLYTLADGSLKQITNQGNITNAQFSPDGKKVLFERTVGGTITRTLHPLDGSAEFTVPGSVPLTAIAWKDSDNLYEPGTTSQTLLLQPLKGTASTIPIALPANTTIRNLSYFSAVQRLVLVADNAVYVIDLTKQ